MLVFLDLEEQKSLMMVYFGIVVLSVIAWMMFCTRWSEMYNFFNLSYIEINVALIVGTISRLAVS